ncbi:uncharacterized protein LOC135943902 [Cloeon dipterum]|uniref:uncharacterized protein LOC135943902 n=1 Tax=Cloeon dipterum TaxID=197152 RepID=UPI00321FB807
MDRSKLKKYMIVRYGDEVQPNGRKAGDVETIPCYWANEFPKSKDGKVHFEYPNPDLISPDSIISLKIKCGRVHASSALACEGTIEGFSNSYERSQQNKNVLVRTGIKPLATSEEENGRRRQIPNKRYNAIGEGPVAAKKAKSKSSQKTSSGKCAAEQVGEGAPSTQALRMDSRKSTSNTDGFDLLGLSGFIDETNADDEDLSPHCQPDSNLDFETECDQLLDLSPPDQDQTLEFENAKSSSVETQSRAATSFDLTKFENVLSELVVNQKTFHKEYMDKLTQVAKQVSMLHQACSKKGLAPTKEYTDEFGLPLESTDGTAKPFNDLNELLKGDRDKQLSLYNILIDCSSGGDLKEIVTSALRTLLDESISMLLVFAKPKKCPTKPSLIKIPIKKSMVCKILIAAIKQVCHHGQVKYQGNSSINYLISRYLTAGGKGRPDSSKGATQRKKNQRALAKEGELQT